MCMRLFYMRAAAAATFSREKPLLNKRTVSAWCILQPTNDHQLVFKRVQRTKPHSVCVCERSENSLIIIVGLLFTSRRCSHIFLVSAGRRRSSDLRFSMHLIFWYSVGLLTKETSHTPAKRHSRPLTARACDHFSIKITQELLVQLLKKAHARQPRVSILFNWMAGLIKNNKLRVNETWDVTLKCICRQFPVELFTSYFNYLLITILIYQRLYFYIKW